MAEICCEVASDKEGTVISCYEPRSRSARRRRMEIRKFRYEHDDIENNVQELHQQKRHKVVGEQLENAAFYSKTEDVRSENDVVRTKESEQSVDFETPKFGFASVCGRRRDMEDAVDYKLSFCQENSVTDKISDLHYFGVFDGHGCSHVAMRCRERMHAVVKDELENVHRADPTMLSIDWKSVLKRSFARMDEEVNDWNRIVVRNDCRCELQTPECDAVGSTAVVAIVTRDKIIVANCGDSRAVLSRSGKAVPLSSDHKPDRPDELLRIEAAGGRVIYWEGARVFGVLAMSRAIGDNYLKPYVICDPEVTITDRTAEDDCLILASDGLWDVVSNEMACGVAKMCLNGKGLKDSPWLSRPSGDQSDKACVDTSMLLTKLALAKHSTDNVSVVVVDLRKVKS